ncbi:hypothetical protein MMC19_007260 [Ptychographa xylographoides]|nr:hypothetical protein [Ptychographa xylographoides]
MDALQSFVFLTDNLPLWISKLHELSQQVSERHAEFTKLSHTTGFGSMRRNKNGSTESLRPNDLHANDTLPLALSDPAASPKCIDVNPDNKHLFQQFREDKLRRKRKSGSILSDGGASGARRLQSRMSLIVYYDSAIQDGFEMLVRNIASARNNLRKGKTAASFKARMASMGMEESPFGNEGTIELRNPSIPRLPRSRNGPYGIEGYTFEAFDRADKDLETAQSLCELGAHQFLRDGNCVEEIMGTKERLENCQRVSEQQATVLRALKQKEKEEEEDKRNKDAEAKADQEDNIQIEVDKISIGPTLAADTQNGMFFTDTIEVDDASDASSIHIDLSAFRSTRRARS